MGKIKIEYLQVDAFAVKLYLLSASGKNEIDKNQNCQNLTCKKL